MFSTSGERTYGLTSLSQVTIIFFSLSIYSASYHQKSAHLSGHVSEVQQSIKNASEIDLYNSECSLSSVI